MLKEEVTEEDIAEVVSTWTGIPVSRLMEGEMQKLVHLEEALHARVVDQVDAVEAVANAIRRSRAGLSDPNRPIGSFLFLGPTGVGKTELARALADYLFDDERAIVRVDMSEYQERHTVSRLVGAPPGYVGYEEGGQLTESVRRRPYSVVLLDELEKAHTDVFNVLLQLLDDGRLTDGQGRTVDFRNTIIIMTSNLGSTVFSDPSIGREKQKAAVLEDVRMTFRPEFVNRIDEIVVFEPLGRDEIRQIVDIQLDGLQRRLEDRKLSVTLTDGARDYLANKGYDPAFGARPLKRLIQREIQDPLAMKLLSGDIKDGDTVEIDVGDGGSGVQRDHLAEAVSRAGAVDTDGYGVPTDLHRVRRRGDRRRSTSRTWRRRSVARGSRSSPRSSGWSTGRRIRSVCCPSRSRCSTGVTGAGSRT